MRIGIDIDDTIADFMSALISFHNTTYRTTLERKHFFSYLFHEVWGGTHEENDEKIRVFNQSKRLDAIAPLPDARRVLADLKKRGHELHVITSRVPDIEEKTCAWLTANFPDMFDTIHFAANHYLKESLAGRKEKFQICVDEHIDVMIDDSLEYARACEGIAARVFLFDQPWNQTDTLPKNVTRVRSWNEIARLLE